MNNKFDTNKNKINTIKYYGNNKMDSTTGKFLTRLIFVFIFSLFFFPVYYTFMNSGNLKVNEFINDDINNKGYILNVYEYRDDLKGTKFYSTSTLTDKNKYTNIKTHAINCRTDNCNIANEYVSVSYSPFIFFKDGDQIGFYDVTKKSVIDYFDKFDSNEKVYFIEGDDTSITSEVFLIINYNTHEFVIYNVENKSKSISYSFDEITFNPFKISSNADYNKIIKNIFNDHILIASNGKFNAFNYKTNKYFSIEGFDSVNCYYSSLYQCKFINEDTEIITKSDFLFDEYSIIINDLNNLYYNVGDYRLINKNDKLSILNNEDMEIYSFNSFNKNDFYMFKINDNLLELEFLLLLKNQDLDDNKCLVNRHVISYDEGAITFDTNAIDYCDKY